ncbi:MAG: hypothetical protein ABJG68_03480 [Crocinitomicaceae bacterium]
MIALLISALLGVSAEKLEEARDLFTTVADNEDSCENLIELTSNYTLDFDPTIYAYHAAATMTMANHVIWPTSKLSYFNEGKKKLETAIKKYPNNIEIRYIRFAVQKGSPDFLGYRKNMQEDKSKIQQNIDKMNWNSEFKSIVRKVIATT